MVYRRPGAGAPAPVPVPGPVVPVRGSEVRFTLFLQGLLWFSWLRFDGLLVAALHPVGRGRGRVFGRYIAKTAVYGFSVSRLACIDYCEMCIRSFY